MKKLTAELLAAAAALQAAGAIRPDHMQAWQAFRVRLEQADQAAAEIAPDTLEEELARTTGKVERLAAAVAARRNDAPPPVVPAELSERITKLAQAVDKLAQLEAQPEPVDKLAQLA